MNFIRNFLRRRKLKRTFDEYGFEIKQFELDKLGTVDYAQWLHPFEQPKTITQANVNFYKKITAPAGMVIDIGAHTGDTTVPMALAVGKPGLVLGLEPNKYVFKILEKNSQLNRDKTTIVPLCFAATKEDGVFEFNYSDASFCNGGFLSQIKSKNHRHDFVLEVAGKNLQNFLLNQYAQQLDKLCLIKIDAEGYDKEIIKTIPEILNRYKPNLMIECYKRLTPDERYELFDLVMAHEYNLYYLQNFEGFGKLEIITRNSMTSREHFEMLAIHKSKRIDF
ncbi:MAG: FkbM family methyltransferase [Cyclobacteriaceae bacterium]|nr:FkbM family methyltransferase [Cyclobacteriaceae bacterium]